MSTAKLTKSAGVVGIAIVISRILGLVRDQVFAFFFGSTWVADAFIVAFRIPNMLRDLFAEGALSQAYIPIFTKKMLQKGEAAAWRLTNLVLNWQILILMPIVLLGIFFAPDLVQVVGRGFQGHTLELTIRLTRIMFPFILLVAVAAVFMGTLNVRHIFFIPASASSMFNFSTISIGILIGILVYRQRGPEAAVVGWAVGTLIGGFTQMAVQLPSLWREGYRYQFVLAAEDSGLGEILRRVVPGIIAVSPVQVNVLVATYFASFLETGSVAWLSYAFRLIFLPIGLFGVGIATVVLPSISKYASEKNLTEFRSHFNHSLRLAMCFAIPSAVGMAIIGNLLIGVIYQRGQFTPSDTVETARILQLYAIGLIGYTALKVIVPAFYALGRPNWPMIVSIVSMFVNFFLSLLFVKNEMFDFGIFDLKARGLALATACSALLNACVLLWMLRMLLEKRIDFHETIVGLLRVACASGIMGFAVYGLWQLFRNLRMPDLLWSNVIQLFLLVGVGAWVFLAAARFLKIREVREMTDMILRKLYGDKAKTARED